MARRGSILAKLADHTPQPLNSQQAYVDGHLTKPAFTSLAILTFITFIGNFTQLQLSAALPTIVADFGITVTTGQWLTSVFQLVMGVMVPLTAYLTRRFSTRQIVLSSMLVFTIGSVLAWLGPTFPLVLLGRTLEAVGTGVMWPVLQITVFSIFPLARRGMAIGTVGMAISVAPAIGPTIGGLQTDASGWRSIFMTLAILGAGSVVLALVGLHNFGTHDPDARADFFSVGLSIIGFGGLMFGFTNTQSLPLSHPAVWLAMLAGVVGIIWFVLRQIFGARRYQKAQTEQASKVDATASGGTNALDTATTGRKAIQPPLLDLGVLRNRSFTIGTICASVSFFAFSSILIIMPLYIQNDRGYSATMSGLIMLPGALGMSVAQFYGGRLLDRFGARPVAITGSVLLLVGTLLMSLVDENIWIWWVSICQFIRLIGMGFVLMPITTWSLNCLDPGKVSAGSAVTNTARQIAGAMGAPILVVIMESLTRAFQASLGLGAEAATAANIAAVQWTLRISAALVLVQLLLVFFGVRGDGAGSAREATRLALSRMHVVHDDTQR